MIFKGQYTLFQGPWKRNYKKTKHNDFLTNLEQLIINFFWSFKFAAVKEHFTSLFEYFLVAFYNPVKAYEKKKDTA